METVMSLLLPSPHNVYSQTLQFVQTDSKELFDINRNKFGNEWYWANHQIEYRYNAAGYRMNKEIEDIDFNNYYAFFGCSFTEGVGIPIEETFAYKIAKAKNVDYINGAVGGASPEFAFYNFLQLIENAPKLPACVIINWPSIERTMYWNEQDQIVFKLPGLNEYTWINSYNEFVMGESHITNRFEMILKAVRLIALGLNIKLYEISISNNTRYNITQIPVNDKRNLVDVKDRHLIFGRDINLDNVAHPGFNYNNNVVNDFLTKYP